MSQPIIPPIALPYSLQFLPVTGQKQMQIPERLRNTTGYQQNIYHFVPSEGTYTVRVTYSGPEYVDLRCYTESAWRTLGTIPPGADGTERSIVRTYTAVGQDLRVNLQLTPAASSTSRAASMEIYPVTNYTP